MEKVEINLAEECERLTGRYAYMISALIPNIITGRLRLDDINRIDGMIDKLVILTNLVGKAQSLTKNQRAHFSMLLETKKIKNE